MAARSSAAYEEGIFASYTARRAASDGVAIGGSTYGAVDGPGDRF